MPGGRPPKPTAILKLTGAFRKDRHGSRVDVALPPGSPTCPTWVRAKAAAYWPQISQMLAGFNVLAIPHAIGLSLLVDALADYVKFSGEADKVKTFVRGSTGNKVINPIFGLKEKAWDRVMKACREFGMTPAAMASVKSLLPEAPPPGMRNKTDDSNGPNKAKSRFFPHGPATNASAG